MRFAFAMLWTLMIVGPVACFMIGLGQNWYTVLAWDLLPTADPDNLGAKASWKWAKRLYCAGIVWGIASAVFFYWHLAR